MQRREFLYTSAAGLAALFQSPASMPARKLKIDISSSHLQWLRSADEVADAVAEMSFDGAVLTVGSYPAHIDPAKIAQDLPAFVNAMNKRDLRAICMTTSITDADAANTEAILKAAASAGITHYSCGAFPYDKSKAVLPQLEALRTRLSKLAALNAKYKMTAMAGTDSSGDNVGSALWDWMIVLKDIDPNQIGIQYDVFQQAQNTAWEFNLKAAGKYVAGFSVRDFAFEQDLGLKG